MRHYDVPRDNDVRAGCCRFDRVNARPANHPEHRSAAWPSPIWSFGGAAAAVTTAMPVFDRAFNSVRVFRVRLYEFAPRVRVATSYVVVVVGSGGEAKLEPLVFVRFPFIFFLFDLKSTVPVRFVTRRSSACKMTATAAALKRLEALFDDAKISDDSGVGEPAKTKRASVEKVHFAVTADCDVHGDGRRKSEHLHNHHHQHHHRGSVVSGTTAALPRRDSVPASIPAASMRRRDSIVLGSPGRDTLCHHPSSFPSSLRRDSPASSTSSLRRDSVGSGRRDSLLSSPPPPHSSSAGVVLRRESTAGAGRKDSVPSWRRFSTDSLDSVRRNSWDPSGRRGSSGSSAGYEDPIWEDKVRIIVFLTVTSLGGAEGAVRSGLRTRKASKRVSIWGGGWRPLWMT